MNARRTLVVLLGLCMLCCCALRADPRPAATHPAADAPPATLAPPAAVAPPATAPATAPAPAPADKTDPDAADRAIKKRLAARISKIEFDDIEIKDVVQFMRDISGLSIHVKWSALTLAGIEKAATVNVHLADVSLARALRVILDDVGGGTAQIDYVVEDGVVIISTREDFHRHAVTRIYPVGDIVASMALAWALTLEPWDKNPFDLRNQLPKSLPASSPATQSAPHEKDLFEDDYRYDQDEKVEYRQVSLNDLMSLLKETIDPTSWRVAGGDVGSIRAFGYDLVITQTQGNHEAIEALLAAIRQAHGKTLPLGVAIVRVEDEEKLASLRQAVEGADAKAVMKTLQEGAQQKKWTLDRCGVEQPRIGEPVIARRLEQVVVEGGRGNGQPPAVLTCGYEIGVLPVHLGQGALDVSVVCSAARFVPPPKDAPPAAPSTHSTRNVFREQVPAAGTHLILAAPCDAGGGVVLVLWQAGEKRVALCPE